MEDIPLSENALEVLEKRYFLKDNRRNVIESTDGLFMRVARYIAQGEKFFKSKYSLAEIEENFYRSMRSLEFMPNSPTLMNSGTSFGQLSACFVLPIYDSLDSIFETLKAMAKIHQTGGGTGFDFSHLRPKGDLLETTKGEASGPVSFMRIFDEATGVIVQGGRRRGANMGILRCDHPDIEEFIRAKTDNNELSNFNISVAATDKFMRSVIYNRNFDLINPRNNKKVRTIKALSLFDLIVNSAWKTGDPGLIFIDQINRKNPTPKIGKIEATNPCGELPLLPYESCNLGSINLSKMLNKGKIDWDKLKNRIYLGIRFLDNVIEMNKFPMPEIKEITLANRKIGLGVMGFADMLIKLGVPYGSRQSIQIAAEVMNFIRKESLNASQELARERGVFPNFEKSIYFKKKIKIRNATVNTIAPTGTISIIADCSSGIEPLFALSYVRDVLSGANLLEVNSLFEEIAKRKRFYSKKLMKEIALTGTLQNIKNIPLEIKKLFVTGFELTSLEHLSIQAAFQRYTDNSVSKTINLPAQAKPGDVRKIYLLAYKLKCKGITVYRYGSKSGQVLSVNYKKNTLIRQENNIDSRCASGSCVFQ